MTILDINASVSGIAGDMLSAALLGLTPQPEVIVDRVVSNLQEIDPTFHVTIQTKSYEGIKGVVLDLSGEQTRVESSDLKHHFVNITENLQIENSWIEVGKNCLRYLFEAEKSVHDSEDAHLHELGTLDTLFDLLCPLLILQDLEVDQINIHPVATGYGSVQTAHGVLPVPSPATQYILEAAKLPTRRGSRGELATPTGVALLAALQEAISPSSDVIWERTSYGYGTKEFDGRPNFVRCSLGHATSEQSEIAILESNLDDVTGEILGDAVDRLLAQGALDVTYYPIIMKKNRPAYCLRVLAQEDLTEKMAHLMMELTGSLGIRIQQIDRHIGDRRIETKSIYVEEWDREYTVMIKHGVRSKIEFDDITRIAKEQQLSPLKTSTILYKYLEGNVG